MSELLLPRRSMLESEIDYNEIENIDPNESDEVNRAKIELFIGKNLCSVLTNHYPKRNWRIGTDVDNGVVYVMCTDVSTEKGYVIHLTRSLQEIRNMLPRIGGEILERAGLSRDRKFNPDTVETLERDSRDNVIATDLTTPEEKNATKQ